MSNLSNVLQLFSNENIQVQKNRSNINYKEFFLSDPKMAREAISIAMIDSPVALHNYSRERYREVKILTCTLEQMVISRNKKINSLKAMRNAGSSLEQLRNMADLYALEGLGDFLLKAVFIVLAILQKMCSAIWSFIKKIFGANKRVKEKVKKASDQMKKPDSYQIVFDQIQSNDDFRLTGFGTKNDEKYIMDLDYCIEKNLSLKELTDTLSFLRDQSSYVISKPKSVVEELRQNPKLQRLEDVSKSSFMGTKDNPSTIYAISANKVLESPDQLRNWLDIKFSQKVDSILKDFENLHRNSEDLKKKFDAIVKRLKQGDDSFIMSPSSVTVDVDEFNQKSSMIQETCTRCANYCQQIFAIAQIKSNVVGYMQANLERLCDFIVESLGEDQYKSMSGIH